MFPNWLSDPSEMLDWVITNGTVVLPTGESTQTDVGLSSGKIVALGDLSICNAKQAFDAKGLHVLPGVIDSQVHFREPGATHKEDLAHGMLGALLGGVTTIFEMPNTNPTTTTVEAFHDKLNRASQSAWTNYAFYVGATAENAEMLPTLERLPGCCGVKLFMGSSTGGLLVPDDTNIETIMRHGWRRMAMHAEDEPRLQERRHIAVEQAAPHAHPEWRDAQAAFKATQRALALSEKTGRAVHILHVTTKDELPLLAQHKHLATVEMTPQHLTLFAPDCYDRIGTYAQMNPPIRTKDHQDALWQALNAGVVDVLGSDHAPHTREEKDRDYPHTPSGMPGVQTLLPVMLNHVHNQRLSLAKLVELVCTNPTRVFGLLNKGRISPGYDGDITVVDLNRTETITHSQMANKSGWTPFDGMSVTGWPVAAFVNGHLAMRDGEALPNPSDIAHGQRCQFLGEEA